MVYANDVYYATFSIAFPTERLAAVAITWQAYGDANNIYPILQSLGGNASLSQIHCKIVGTGNSKTIAYIACGY